MLEILTIISDTLTQSSQAIMAVAALVALWQIILAKESVVIGSKRESIILAERVAKELITKHTALSLDERKGFKIYRWMLKDKNFSNDSLKDSTEAVKWVESLTREQVIQCTNFLNEIEAFSMYFVHDAADKKVACEVVGPAFCMWIEEFSPLLIQLREDPQAKRFTSGSFQNSIELYKTWSKKLYRNKLWSPKEI